MKSVVSSTAKYLIKKSIFNTWGEKCFMKDMTILETQTSMLSINGGSYNLLNKVMVENRRTKNQFIINFRSDSTACTKYLA